MPARNPDDRADLSVPPVLSVLPPEGGSGNRRWALGAGVLLLLAAALWVLHRFPPEAHGFYPRCGLHTLTGLHCPGCGSLRALHHLTRGDWGGALHANALVVLSPLALGLGWLARRGPGSSCSTGRAWGIAGGVIVLFGALRNLPFEPFRWLAP